MVVRTNEHGIAQSLTPAQELGEPLAEAEGSGDIGARKLDAARTGLRGVAIEGPGAPPAETPTERQAKIDTARNVAKKLVGGFQPSGN